MIVPWYIKLGIYASTKNAARKNF